MSGFTIRTYLKSVGSQWVRLHRLRVRRRGRRAEASAHGVPRLSCEVLRLGHHLESRVAQNNRPLVESNPKSWATGFKGVYYGLVSLMMASLSFEV